MSPSPSSHPPHEHHHIPHPSIPHPSIPHHPIPHPSIPPSLARAYAACASLARAHYENFPVASRLLPRPMRPHVAAVYAFARVADAIAAEGPPPPPHRPPSPHACPLPLP